MLIDTPPRAFAKRLCLVIRNDAFRRVLGAILKEWRYTLMVTPAASDLLLAEEGCAVPEECGPVLWLTRSRYGERGRLPLPLSIEELWSALESRFHKPPRNHIRISLQHPVTVHAREESSGSHLISLSDLGGRLAYHRELAPGEELGLRLTVAGRPLALEGRVIYVIPRGDLEGSGKTQIGVIFDRLPQEMRDGLREFIIRSYLERVRTGMPGSTFREGLGHFDVAPAVVAVLGGGPA